MTSDLGGSYFAPKCQCLRHVIASYVRFPGEIGDCPGDSPHAVHSPSCKKAAVDGLADQAFGIPIKPVGIHLSPPQPSIDLASLNLDSSCL